MAIRCAARATSRLLLLHHRDRDGVREFGGREVTRDRFELVLARRELHLEDCLVRAGTRRALLEEFVIDPELDRVGGRVASIVGVAIEDVAVGDLDGEPRRREVAVLRRDDHDRRGGGSRRSRTEDAGEHEGERDRAEASHPCKDTGTRPAGPKIREDRRVGEATRSSRRPTPRSDARGQVCRASCAEPVEGARMAGCGGDIGARAVVIAACSCLSRQARRSQVQTRSWPRERRAGRKRDSDGSSSRRRPATPQIGAEGALEGCRRRFRGRGGGVIRARGSRRSSVASCE